MAREPKLHWGIAVIMDRQSLHVLQLLQRGGGGSPPALAASATVTLAAAPSGSLPGDVVSSLTALKSRPAAGSEHHKAQWQRQASQPQRFSQAYDSLRTQAYV